MTIRDYVCKIGPHQTRPDYQLNVINICAFFALANLLRMRSKKGQVIATKIDQDVIFMGLVENFAHNGITGRTERRASSSKNDEDITKWI